MSYFVAVATASHLKITEVSELAAHVSFNGVAGTVAILLE